MQFAAEATQILVHLAPLDYLKIQAAFELQVNVEPGGLWNVHGTVLCDNNTDLSLCSQQQ